MIRGYVHDSKLPTWALPGSQVRFAKGTRLLSMHPQKRGSYQSAKTQTVTINHVLSGQSIRLGTLYLDDTFYNEVRLKDIAHVAERLGMPDPWRNADATFEWLRKCPAAEVRPYKYGSNLREVWLHTLNPSVRWPGTGGYWVEVDINDVTPVEAA